MKRIPQQRATARDVRRWARIAAAGATPLVMLAAAGQDGAAREDPPLPSVRDLKEFWAHQKWFFGRGPQPDFDKGLVLLFLILYAMTFAWSADIRSTTARRGE